MTEIIRRLAWPALVLAIGAAGLATLPTAAVASPAAPAAAPAAAREVLETGEHDALLAQGRCYVTPRRGLRYVSVYRSSSTRSRTIGRIYERQRARAYCNPVRGDYYSMRGCTRSNRWVRVTIRQRTGWVPLGCVRLYEER